MTSASLATDKLAVASLEHIAALCILCRDSRWTWRMAAWHVCHLQILEHAVTRRPARGSQLSLGGLGVAGLGVSGPVGVVGLGVSGLGVADSAFSSSAFSSKGASPLAFDLTRRLLGNIELDERGVFHSSVAATASISAGTLKTSPAAAAKLLLSAKATALGGETAGEGGRSDARASRSLLAAAVTPPDEGSCWDFFLIRLATSW